MTRFTRFTRAPFQKCIVYPNHEKTRDPKTPCYGHTAEQNYWDLEAHGDMLAPLLLSVYSSNSGVLTMVMDFGARNGMLIP